MRERGKIFGSFQQRRIAQGGKTFFVFLYFFAGGVDRNFLRWNEYMCTKQVEKTNLAAFVDKNQLEGVVGTFCDGDHLCSNPGMIFVLKPDSRALAIDVLCHGITTGKKA
jgi:hypothetical protein